LLSLRFDWVCFSLLIIEREKIYDWIDKEPSGIRCTEPVFNHDGKPHNALINTGSLLVCALLIKEGKNFEDILDYF